MSSLKMSHAVLDSPSAERNKGPIWDVLSKKVLPELIIFNNRQQTNTNTEDAAPSSPSFDVLEIAAGAGVHTEYFVEKTHDLFLKTANNAGPSSSSSNSNTCGLTWLPTDPEEASRDSIDARSQAMISSGSALATTHTCVKRAESLTLEETGPIEGECMLSRYNLITCINMIHISPWAATVGLMRLAGARLKPGGVLFCYGPYKENGAASESNL
jgi:hypothetical protein